MGITSLVSGWFINIHPLASYVHEYINWYDSATRFTSLLYGYTWGTGVCVKCVRATRSCLACLQSTHRSNQTSSNNSITLTFTSFSTKTITRNTSLSLLFLTRKHFNRFLILYINHSPFKHIIILKRFIIFLQLLFLFSFSN